MLKRIAILLSALLIGGLVSTSPANAGSWCNDGTYSRNSSTGSCSWHGGVNKRYPSYPDYGSSSWNRQYNPSTSFGRNQTCYTSRDWLGRQKKTCY